MNLPDHKPKIKFFSLATLAYFLIVVYVIIFIIQSIGRHEALKSYQNDLGTYSQLLWNTAHGHFFEASGALLAITLRPDGTTIEDFNYLSAHFSPILLLLVPFYALWSDPKLLLIIQTVAVGLGALPIFWLAREKIGNPWAGFVFLVGYLFNPILHNALLYDFHEVTMAVPIVSYALWCWYKKKTGWLLFLLFLLLLVQEHTSLIVLMFGLYLAFIQKRRKFGLAISAVGLAYFLITMLLIIPVFSSTGQSTIIQAAVFPTRYQWLGSTIGEMVNTAVHEPMTVIKNLFGPWRIDFLVTLLIPLFGFPVFSGLFLLTVPVLLIYFLSQFRLMYSVYFYHSSLLIGILYFSAIFAFSRLLGDKKWRTVFLILILSSSLIVSFIYSVTPLSANYSWQDYQPSGHSRLIKEVKALVPAEAAISVQHNLGPHFANRRKLWHFPFMLDKADYVIVDVYNPYADNPKSFYGFENVREMDLEFYLTSLNAMFSVKDFGVIYSQDGWFVFKRGAPNDKREQALAEFQKDLRRLAPSLE